ncbi:fam-g protein [Plasmodium gallinaceum]|uniref:Fam-g protein n=1 Tax=Plasmodium gallinaceum TaxID=5849 RepID=A0A1J1GWX4_PLAGA|nr:fam-g protein [Plasmodium gallinaceum]CRG95519.1 fam-g protein [Plasmodium gallinaceum]
MKTLTLYLKISTFLLFIWIYQCFYNCDSYKTLVDKNILQTKNELKYERVLTEGDIAEKKKTNTEGCLQECPLDNKKNKCKEPDLYNDPCNYLCEVIVPQFLERFNNEISEKDPKSKSLKWNDYWNKILTTKVKELFSIYHRRNIPDEEINKKIDSIMREVNSEFEKFLCECKNQMTDNKTESEYKKEMRKNKTESESKRKMIDHKAESESKKELIDDKTESQNMKELIENKTEFECRNKMIENKTEFECRNEMIDNKTESESMKEMIDNKAESESWKEQESNEINNCKLKIFKLHIVLIILSRI